MKRIAFWLIPLILIWVLIPFAGCASKKETVTIKYAAWNLGEPEKNGLERQMIKAFMEKFPQIKVEIEENFTKNYNDAFKTAAADNAIPDVFMYAGNPEVNTNGWCAELTDIVANDKEWSNIPLPFQEAAQIKGKTIAVPSAMYFYGYFGNESLFNARQVGLPKAGFSVQQFKSAISKMTDIKNGSIGLADESSIVEWYPAAVNSRMGWYTWDGGKFNLNSKEFKAGIKLAKSFNENRQTFAFLTEAERKNLKGANDWEAWNAGTVALKFDGTWIAADYAKLPFKTVFLGIPGGRTCIVPDFMFIAKNSKHPQEAYQFIKFMSAYSLEGFAKRMELARANNLVVTTIPMIKNERLINEYFAGVKVDGIKDVYDRLDNASYVEGVKVLPGYNQARWEYNTNIKVGKTENAKIGDVLINTYRGDLPIEEVAPQLDSLANECVQIFPRFGSRDER